MYSICRETHMPYIIYTIIYTSFVNHCIYTIYYKLYEPYFFKTYIIHLYIYNHINNNNNSFIYTQYMFNIYIWTSSMQLSPILFCPGCQSRPHPRVACAGSWGHPEIRQKTIMLIHSDGRNMNQSVHRGVSSFKFELIM